MSEQIVDLYEITIYAECDGVRARIDKYPTKRTGKNFLPLRVTDEMAAQGYSHRMYSRVPITDLNTIQRVGHAGVCDHVWRQAYCLFENRETIFNIMRTGIDVEVRRLHERTKTLLAAWEKDSAGLKPAVKKPKKLETIRKNREELGMLV